jgi:replicative DNA helicase
MPVQPFNPGGDRDRPKRPAVVAFPEDRLPPQNLEAEQGVLGAILIDNEILHDIVPLLKADDFWRDAHQIIYRAIRELYDAGKPVDITILADELTRTGEYERVGGWDGLAELANRVPHAANAKYHAEIVRQKAIKREVISAGREILEEGYSDSVTADQLLEGAERRIFGIAEETITGETVALTDILGQAMDRIELRATDKHAVNGLASGYYELDAMACGLQPGQLIILAARPSMGKTAFALNVCESVCVEQKKGVLFVSLEMGQLELAERMLSARARVDGQKLRSGMGLGYREMKQLGAAYDELRSAPLFIDDTPARNMLQITANARRLRLREDIALIVVDYIQLIDSEGEGRESRQEQIAKISRRLKTLARELKVPVIALSQLNRNVENREDRRPRMADLRESGAIEQDADMIWMLHRPEYYDKNDQPGIAECLVQKNRNGATGDVKMTFLKNIMRFENLATMSDPIDGGAF